MLMLYATCMSWHSLNFGVPMILINMCRGTGTYVYTIYERDFVNIMQEEGHEI